MRAARGVILLFPFIAPGVFAQSTVIPRHLLDPTRSVTVPQLESATHRPLPDQYIWTAEQQNHAAAAGKEPPRFFRRVFRLSSSPPVATLYIAGPISFQAFVNGKLVEQVQSNLDSHIQRMVYAKDVAPMLRTGNNVIAIEAVPGTARPITGEIRKLLAVKLIPAARGIDAPAFLISDEHWKGSTADSPGWEGLEFNDRGWKPVHSLGSMEGSIDFFQWNDDAGLYQWPGYDGISPFLAHLPVTPVSLSHVYSGTGSFRNLEALTAPTPDADPFTVELPSERVDSRDAPRLLLDFGREVTGRLQFISASAAPEQITVQYGESVGEALDGPYLGVNPLRIAPHATAYGPKSAFRYALIRFLGGSQRLRFQSIRLDQIYYPVRYQGFFDSSDAQLNLMWTVGAYTAHLCMQDDIWDAPKRDRGRWMGDLDVSGRTIEDVFNDHFLMEDTLNRLIGPAPVDHHVNSIAGYSAAWITGEAEYYRHTGSKQQLDSFHDRLIQLMRYMETELDSRDLYANRTHSWPFVDWSPELNGDTAEARRATQFEFYGAFRQGVYLLNQMGDPTNAGIFQRVAERLKAAAQHDLLDPSTNSFGSRWQTNAAAVISGAAEPSQYDSIWRASLSSVGKIKYNALIITPYYNYYVVTALAEMGRRAQALNWIRQYWGGMLDEGATTFWEGYDPSWYKHNFHASLQADNGTGYFVSLSHGWSSGVTPWIMEQILGIHSTGAGFSTVDIRPDLIDLQWARGGEPTPRGMLNVSIKKSGAGADLAIDLPPGTAARVLVPVAKAGETVVVNGKAEKSSPVEDGTRAAITLDRSGHFEISAR